MGKMTWDELLALSVRPTFRATLRSRLVQSNSHFLHKTHASKLDSIIAVGLVAQPDEHVRAPPWVNAAGLPDKALFVTPSSSTQNMNVTGADTLLAFRANALPSDIGLDRTFRDALSIAAGRFALSSPTDLVSFTIDFMTENSTVLCYEHVPASELLRWDGNADTLGAPSNWPLLVPRSG
jgi:hypothetical protein